MSPWWWIPIGLAISLGVSLVVGKVISLGAHPLAETAPYAYDDTLDMTSHQS
jgi:hypothetical protein